MKRIDDIARKDAMRDALTVARNREAAMKQAQAAAVM
jgi:hypothetical protein